METIFPGEGHVIYDARDVLGELPAEYAYVLERASRWLGVEERFVGGVIETFEHRFARWWAAERRRAKTQEETRGKQRGRERK